MERGSEFVANTYSFLGGPKASEASKLLSESGFLQQELMFFPDHLWSSDSSRLEITSLRRAVDEGVSFTSTNMTNIDMNICSNLPEIRSATLSMLNAMIGMTAELGAQSIILSPGKPNPLLPAPKQVMQSRLEAALTVLCPVADRLGVQILLENLPVSFLPSTRDLVAFIRAYGNKNIGVVYDVANAHFIGEDIADGLHECTEHLRLIHVSDTTREKYKHDPVGLGDVPFGDLFRACTSLHLNVPIVLEIVAPDAPVKTLLQSSSQLSRMKTSFSQPNY